MYDKYNEILGFSLMAQEVLPKKKLECRYLSDIFGSVRRIVHKTSQTGEDNLICPSRKAVEIKKYDVNLKSYKTSDF